MGTATDSDDEEGYLGLPAGPDFPRGLDEASWWPFVCAIGATGIYTGAGFFLIGWGELDLVPKFLGPLVFGGGVFTALVGMFGWLYHAFVEPYWAEGKEVVNADVHRLGMLLFVVTDIATFAAGFTYYYFIRVGSWPGPHVPEEMISPVLIVNTVLLVSSSFTFEFAHDNLTEGNRRKFLGWLATTLLFGLGFVGGQVYEYYKDIVKEGFTLSEGIFGSAFFGLTGLHGMHVITGTILIGILLVRALSGQFTPDRDTAVKTVAMYWHFVDAIWIVIVTSLYVGATYA